MSVEELTTRPEMARPSVLDGLIGTELGGRFRILDRIGQGAMGAVFRAEQTTIGRRVAVKVLKPELAMDPRMGVRFKREARAASRIESPHVVTIHDFGESNGLFFIAMELLDGASLATHIERRGTLPPSESVAIATAVARALAAGHEAGVVHRDLKPDNVVLTKRGVVKVLDFGIAKLLEDAPDSTNESTLTQMGAIVGTPLYMSPECAAREPVGRAADLYALGIMLYELLTGSPPFVEDVLVILLGMHVQTPAPPLVGRHPGLRIPPELDHLVMRLLSKSPEARGTADEVVEELERIAQRGLATWDSLTDASLARDPARAADWWRSQRGSGHHAGSGVQSTPALGHTAGAPGAPRPPVPDDVFESAQTTLAAASGSGSGARPLPATQHLPSEDQRLPAPEPQTQAAAPPYAALASHASGQTPLGRPDPSGPVRWTGPHPATPMVAQLPAVPGRPAWLTALLLGLVGLVLLGLAGIAAALLLSAGRSRPATDSAAPAVAPPAAVPPASNAPAPAPTRPAAPVAPAPSLPLGLDAPPSMPATTPPEPGPTAPAPVAPPVPAAPAARTTRGTSTRVPRPTPFPTPTSPRLLPPPPAPRRACPPGYVCD